jgi:hypothetical protein
LLLALALLVLAAGVYFWMSGERKVPGARRDFQSPELPGRRLAAPPRLEKSVAPPPVIPPSAVAPMPSGTTSASTDSPIGRFQEWQRRFLAASPAERAAMEAEGAQLAAARRPVFKQLIKENPREALQQAVPMAARQQLPASVVEQLEERLNGVAALRVYQGVPHE